MEDINWRDTIQLLYDPYFSGNVDLPSQHYIERIETFLDEFQRTPFGQDILRSVQKKYGTDEVLERSGTNMLRIGVNDNFRSATLSDGQITLDVRDETSLAFIDQNTGNPMLMLMERTLVHELVHAADPKIEIYQNNQEHCHAVAVEEYATQQTDFYGQQYAPYFGVRGVYGNIANAEERDKLFSIEQNGDPIAMINNDPSVRAEIQDAIESVAGQIAACSEGTHNHPPKVILPVQTHGK